MRLALFKHRGSSSWGQVSQDGRQVRPIRGGLCEWGAALTETPRESAVEFIGDDIPLTDVRLRPPFERGSKVMVVGANYRKHLAQDFKIAEPSAPHVFMKPGGALIGAKDDIAYPRLTDRLDYEVELVVVFGKPLGAGGGAAGSILGYMVGNDISARDLQPGAPGIGMDLLSAKGLDGTCPVGPWIVTHDEFGGKAPDLAMTTRVNGETRQDSRTSAMTWDVFHLSRYVADRTRLEPGDIMFTGTPEGVGQASGRFLSDGDLVETAIEGLGTLRNVVRRPPV